LRGHGRWEDPGISDLAEIGDGPFALDLMLGEAAEQLKGDVFVG